MSFEIITGDAIDALAGLPESSVQACITSPPYWGLRDYGVAARVWDDDGDCDHVWAADRFCRGCGAWRGCLGLEPTPDLFVSHLVEMVRGVRRVLRDDGTLWLVIGDSYALRRTSTAPSDPRRRQCIQPGRGVPPGAKIKDLIGIPWLVAFALRSDGWWLRSDIVWAKQNVSPESVRDRPTRCHEFVFLLTKQAKYFYDPVAIREPARVPGTTRNRRDVWWIRTRPKRGGHIAAYPPEIVEPCLRAGSPPHACKTCGAPWRRVDDSTAEWIPSCSHDEPPGKSTVLDPFCGSGTTGDVALRHGRDFVGIELKPEYAQLASARLQGVEAVH